MQNKISLSLILLVVIIFASLLPSEVLAQTPDFTAMALDEFGQPVDTLKANPGDVVYIEIQGVVSPVAYCWGAVMVEVSSAQILSVEESYDWWHSGMGLWWTGASADPARGGAGSLYYYNHIHSADNDVYKSEGSSWATAYAQNNPEPFLAGPAGSIYNPDDPTLPSSARFYYSGYLGDHSLTRPGIRIGLRIQDASSLTVKISNHTRYAFEWFGFDKTNEVALPVAPRENHQSVHTEGNNVWIQVSGPASAKVGDTVTVSTYGELMNDSWLYDASLERTESDGVTSTLISANAVAGNEWGPISATYQITHASEEICDGLMIDIGSIPELEPQSCRMTYPVIPDLPEIIGPPTIDPSIDFNGLTVISQTDITETVPVNSSTVNVEVTVENMVGNVVATGVLPASNGTAAGPITLPADLPDGYYNFIHTALDEAGNRSYSYTHSVKLDLEPPGISYEIIPEPVNGWNNTPVTVRFTAEDAESGASWSPVEVTIDTQGVGIPAGPCIAIDGVGNESDPLTVFVNIDIPQPVVWGELVPSTPDGNIGWYKSQVTVYGLAKDALGRWLITTPVSYAGQEGRGNQYFFYAFDSWGQRDEGLSPSFNQDTEKPYLTGLTETTTGGPDWFQSVSIKFQVDDWTSGIEGPTEKTVTVADGRNQFASWTVSDIAGNQETFSYGPYNVDSVKPTIKATNITPAPTNGWNNTDVTVEFTATDPAPSSGIAIPVKNPEIIPVTCGGGQVLQISVVSSVPKDKAGNEGVFADQQIKIDKAPPTVSYPIVGGSQVITKTVVQKIPGGISKSDPAIMNWLNAFGASDVGSGLVGGQPPPANNAPSVFPVGTTLVTFTARDIAGNSSTPLKGWVVVEPVKVTLKSITFSTDHEDVNGNNLLKNNNSTWGKNGEPYAEPEWQKDPVRNYPITHSKNKKVGLTVTLEISPSYLSEQDFSITGNSGQSYLDFSTNGKIVGGSQNISIEAAAKLPDMVNVINQGISWEISLGQLDFDLGQTINSIYVTYDTPWPIGDLTEKRISWDCYTCQGKKTLNEIADAIYTDFATPPPNFALGSKAPSDLWLLMAGGSNEGECIDLARLMKQAVELLGGNASIGYVYGSTDTDCFSTKHTDYETRKCKNHGHEELSVWSAGGWNNWEAVCNVGGTYYAIQVYKGTPIEILRSWLGSNQISGNYQAWAYKATKEWKGCQDPGPYPVPKP